MIDSIDRFESVSISETEIKNSLTLGHIENFLEKIQRKPPFRQAILKYSPSLKLWELLITIGSSSDLYPLGDRKGEPTNFEIFAGLLEEKLRDKVSVTNHQTGLYIDYLGMNELNYFLELQNERYFEADSLDILTRTKPTKLVRSRASGGPG